MTRNTQSAQTGQLVELELLPLLVDPSQAAAVRSALENINLRLPAGGRYYAELSGRVLHLHEGAKGISRYAFEDPSIAASTELAGGEFHIEIDNVSSVKKVVLHSAPSCAPSSAVTLDELDAPVGKIQQLARLLNRQSLTADEVDEKRRLLREIGDQFHRIREEEEQQTPRAARCARTTRSSRPITRSSSGESARGGTSCG